MLRDIHPIAGDRLLAFKGARTNPRVRDLQEQPEGAVFAGVAE